MFISLVGFKNTEVGNAAKKYVNLDACSSIELEAGEKFGVSSIVYFCGEKRTLFIGSDKQCVYIMEKIARGIQARDAFLVITPMLEGYM